MAKEKSNKENLQKIIKYMMSKIHLFCNSAEDLTALSKAIKILEDQVKD